VVEISVGSSRGEWRCGDRDMKMSKKRRRIAFSFGLSGRSHSSTIDTCNNVIVYSNVNTCKYIIIYTI
jgi:hypothetical protein